MIELPPERCSAFIAGERVVSLCESAENVRERLRRGLPLLVQSGETIATVPAEQVERVEDDWHAYIAALAEGFRELIEEPEPPRWRGAVPGAG